MANELIERCADLARLGLSDSAIAERLGIHPNTATKKRVLGGVRRPHPTITPEQEEQIHILADEDARARFDRMIAEVERAAASRALDALLAELSAPSNSLVHRCGGQEYIDTATLTAVARGIIRRGAPDAG